MSYRKILEEGQPFNPFNMYHGIYIPTGLVECSMVSDQVKILMGRLFQYAGKNGKAYPYRDTLAKECGWKISKLDKVIKQAKDLRLIKTRPFDKTDEENPPNEYVFLYSKIYDEGDGVVKKDNDPVVKDYNTPVVKRYKQKRIILKENHRDLDKSKSEGVNAHKTRRKLPKITKTQKDTKTNNPDHQNTKKHENTKRHNADTKTRQNPDTTKRQSENTKKSKYKITTTDLRNYNEMKNAGATNHRADSKAEIDTLDKLHAMFSGRCDNPFNVVHVPEQYVDFEWDLDDLIDTFKFQLEHAAEYNMKPVRAAGRFILSEGFNGAKSWSPLLYWHQKMNKTAKGELSEEGEKLYSSLKSAKIRDLEKLDSSIVNKVAAEIEKNADKFVFCENDQHRTREYLQGLYSVTSKYIREKMNNLTFKLVYITKDGFVDEVLSVAQERNIVKKVRRKRSI